MDERARVREALQRWVAAGGWPAADVPRARNALLDLCGSDARPVVELLLAHADLVEQLLAASAGAPWSTRREQGARVLTQRGLRFDDAAWVVECWAYARGLIGAHALLRQRAHAAPPAPLPAPATTSRPARQPAWAYSTRGGTGPARWRGGTPVSALPRWTRTDKLAGAALAVLFVTVTGGAWMGIGRAAAEREALIAASALPVSAGVGRTSTTRPDAVDAVDAPDAARGDNPLRVTAAPRQAFPTDDANDADAPVPPPATLSLPDDPRFAAPLLARGVGGRYVVWRALVELSGDDGCEQLERSIDWQQPTDEVVAHVPGHTVFAFSSRTTVRGALGWDGEFVATPVVGAMDGGSYRFAMRGRFTDDGFEAESETISRVLVKWRTWRTCRLVASMRGVRRDEPRR